MTESEKRHLNVILEEMNGKLNLVLEGHEALDGKIERHHREAKADHCLVMDLLKFSHGELDKKIDVVRVELKAELQTVDRHSEERDKKLAAELYAVDKRSEERDKKLAAKIDSVREDLSGEMAAGFKHLGDKVEGHEDRIRFLERNVA